MPNDREQVRIYPERPTGDAAAHGICSAAVRELADDVVTIAAERDALRALAVEAHSVLSEWHFHDINPERAEALFRDLAAALAKSAA